VSYQANDPHYHHCRMTDGTVPLVDGVYLYDAAEPESDVDGSGGWVHLGYTTDDGCGYGRSYSDDGDHHDVWPAYNGGTVVVTGQVEPDAWEQLRTEFQAAFALIVAVVNEVWSAIVAVAAAFEAAATRDDLGREVYNPPGYEDPVAMISDTLDNVCICGCRRPVPDESVSAWFRSEDCQRRWETAYGAPQ